MNRSSLLFLLIAYAVSGLGQSYMSNNYFKHGIELFHQKKYEEAIAEFRQTQEIDENELDSLDYRKQYTKDWIAHCYYKLSNIVAAEATGAVDYDVTPIDRTLISESDSITNLASIIASNGNINYAITKMLDAIRLEEQILGKNHYIVANSHSVLASMYLTKNDLVNVEKELNIAKSIYLEKKLNKSYVYGILLLREAFFFMSKNDCNAAIQCAEEAVKRFLKWDNAKYSELINAYYILSYCHSVPSPDYKSEKYINLLYEQILKISEFDIYNYSEQIVTCCKGLQYFQRYTESLNLLQQTLDKVQNGNFLLGADPFYISLLYSRARVLLGLNKVNEALSDAKTILAVCENAMFYDKNQLDEVYVLLADIYQAKQDYSNELSAATEAFEKANNRNNINSKITAKFFIAKAHSTLGNMKEASSCIQELLDMCVQNNMNRSALYADGLLVKAGIELDKNAKQAIEDCIEGLDIYNHLTPVPFDRVISAYQALYQCYKRSSRNKEAQTVLDKMEEISQKEDISQSIRDRIRIYYNSTLGNKYINEAPLLSLKYFINAKNIASKNEGLDITDIDCYIAKCYAMSGNFNKAILIMDSVLIKLQNNPDMQMQYANALNFASFIYASKGDAKRTNKYIESSMTIFEKMYGKNSRQFALSLTSAAHQMEQLGLPYESQQLCKKAEKTMKLLFDNDSPEIAQLYSIMQAAELVMGNTDKALKYGEIAREISQKYDTPLIYCEILTNLSDCYVAKSQFNKALSLLNDAMKIAEKENGRINMRCALIFQKLGLLCSQMGNVKDAKTYYDCYYDIVKHELNPEHPQYGMAILYDASKELENGNIETAYTTIDKAIDIFKKNLGTDNPVTILAETTKAQVHLKEGKLDEATHLLEKAYALQKKNKLVDASTMNSLATVYTANKQYKKLKSIADDIYDINTQKYGSGSQQVGIACFHIANAYGGMNNIKKSAEYSQKAFKITQNTVLRNFALMTKNERANFWNSISNYFMITLPTICATQGNHSEFSGITYNAALLSKGLLLQAETNLVDNIFKSNNDDLINEYYHFTNTKNLYRNATTSYPIEADVRERLKAQALIDSLENEVNMQEHSLMEHAQQNFGDYTLSLSTEWKDVKKRLNKSDIAVEFLTAKWSDDSIKYFALVIAENEQYPVFIDIANRNQISKYENFKECLFQELSVLSKIVWEPILLRFPLAHNIYFSPCEEFYKIPIESLPMYDDEKSLLSDKYNFYRLSSTRELVTNYSRWKENKLSAYGGVKYSATINELIEDAKQYSNTDVRDGSFIDFANRGGGIKLKPLPGTEKEVNSIVNMINSQGDSLIATPYVGERGTEASIKSLSGRGVRILHIGTHGFYFPDEKVSNSKYLQNIFSIQERGGNYTYDSPEDNALLRCGLYMAGAQTKLDGKGTEGVDDGILTAREISMLNLTGLDLAVLSACETGIGDVTGDGVFGLQRGFKKAGTHSILMSLWKVNDEATSFLMTNFYKNLLLSGNKHIALEKAKEATRARLEWNSPRYWAAFVLLDGVE